MPTPSLPLVLASGSPRRRELLALLGIATIVAPAHVDETPGDGEPPAAHALRVAREKALAASSAFPDLPVLGADTVVVVDGRSLGKPGSSDHARAMLRSLSGRGHVVLTALHLRWRGCEAQHLEASRVTFATIPEALLDWYVETGEGDDKAGAYALQGRAALLIERVEGNVQSVIGLPLAPLPRLLARVGLELVAVAGGLSLRDAPARRARSAGSWRRCGGR